MLKFVAGFVLVLLIGFLAFQIIVFMGKEKRLAAELATQEGQLERAETTQQSLRAELSGYENPDQMEREIKKRFNYRRPDEKMLIIIPEHASSSETH